MTIASNLAELTPVTGVDAGLSGDDQVRLAPTAIAEEVDSMPSSAVWQGGKSIKVSEVIGLYPRLGVPHFQRGRVWGRDSIAALLESLFYDTPCGSFVFWDSGLNAAHGVALDESKSAAVDHLVIDGQQRIRSIHDAFTDAQLNEDEESDPQGGDEATKRPKQWCINLAKAPGFDDLVKPRSRNFPLFVYTTDPQTASTRSPLRENVLPLTHVRATASWDGLARYHDVVAFRSGVTNVDGTRLCADRYGLLRSQILSMQDRDFFVARRGPASSLAQMAELYNRINASGKQVDTEERAFATLVGLQANNTSISDGLRHLFSTIHADRGEIDSRDALLRREEERAFGFKLFIRVFLQVCQYHLGYRQGRSSFSFDLVDRAEFRLAFAGLSGDRVSQLWTETTRVLDYVRTLLADELHCDDLRSLPDATGLMPVLQLLIQYPDLEHAQFRSLMAALCLRMALADLGGRGALEWVARASDPTRLALEVLPQLMTDATVEASKQLAQRLEEADSIQNRYVLLLYWLERHLGAHDFGYDRVPNPECRLAGPARLLDRAARPEKQHLVPFSYAPTFFESAVSRGGAHPFNNIGNLTYISAELNGLKCLNNDFGDLAGERDADGASANLVAHLMMDAAQDGPIADYEWMRKHCEATPRTWVKGDPEERLKRFSALTAARRRLIRSGFERWLHELDADTFRTLRVNSLVDLEQLAKTKLRVAPQRPLFPVGLDPAHLLRSLGLGTEVQDRLFTVLRKVKPEPMGESGLRIQITKKKHVWLRVKADGVVLGVRHLNEQLRAGVFEVVAAVDSGASEQRLDPVPDFTNLLDFCEKYKVDIARSVRPTRTPAAQAEIGDLKYPKEVLERLILLGGDNRKKPRDGADLSLRFQSKVGGGIRQVLRVDLYRSGRTLGFRFGQQLGQDFRNHFPGLPFRIMKKLTFCELEAYDVVPVLEWVATRLPRV